MPDRYFVETPIADRHALLEGAEAHHLAHVMRARPGHEVTLFDGSGAEFDARVERVGRSTVELAIVARVEVDRELPRPVELGVALPKGDRQRWLVEKATELGVARLVPLITARGVAQPVAAALVRLRRTVIESSKQCGRNRLMEIAEPALFRDYVSQPASGAQRWIAHRLAAQGKAVGTRHPQPLAPPGGNPGDIKQPIAFAVGPEGGFIEDEVGLALDAGWQPLDLGARILRVETAAIAAAAWAALSAIASGSAVG